MVPRPIESASGAVVAHPAATVVLLRDGAEGCEALLVRRNARLSFHGGAWVFPGGRIDPADHAAAGGSDIIAVARHAAVREAAEEAGVTLAHGDLSLFSRWVTPEEAPKRFDTWFFLARVHTDRVRVDGGEIHDYRWLRPHAALAARAAGEIDLPPPTFVTLTQIAPYRGAAEVLATAASGGCEEFVPRLRLAEDGACTVYAGDVAYTGGDLHAAGPRHRLWMRDTGWEYERIDVVSLTQNTER